MFYNFSDIPSLFHSSETGALMERCLSCDKPLLDGAEYMIEKAFVNYPGMNTRDLIWEFAMCTECMESLKKEYSEDSNRRISEFFKLHMDLSHQQELDEQNDLDADNRTSKCIITGKAREECSQYQIYAYCTGNMCLFRNTPFMVSDEAMDEIVKLISAKTLGFMNDFRNKHFPPPEDLSPFFREKDFVLI